MAEENHQQYLYDFFEHEVNLHNEPDQDKYIVSFNIGTYGNIEQELNDEWLYKIAPLMFDSDYTKVFYYIDSEYRKINIKDCREGGFRPPLCIPDEVKQLWKPRIYVFG